MTAHPGRRQGRPTPSAPIFEPVFDDANFGYRRGRSTKDALRKVWKEIEVPLAGVLITHTVEFP